LVRELNKAVCMMNVKVVNGRRVISSDNERDIIPYNPPSNDFVMPKDFKLPKRIEDLTPKQIEMGLAMNEILKARNLVVRAGIDFDSKVKQFLETYNDKVNTCKTYKAGINKYIQFCNETGIKLLFLPFLFLINTFL
jgi:hypothetical protein